MNEISPQSFEGHLQRGDLHAAADWLVRAHGRDVLHLCTAIVRDRGTAEDLAQDSLIRALAGLDRFEMRSPGAFAEPLDRPSMCDATSAMTTRARARRCGLRPVRMSSVHGLPD